MDQILIALKCVNCSSTLTAPTVLPCGHSICNKHLTINDDKIKCGKCGIEHSKSSSIGFPQVEALAMIIDSDISNLDFGTIHKEAKSECNNLASIHDQIELLINDPMYHIHEQIETLRNKAQLKYETIRLQIDKEFERCLNNLTIYENECKEKLRLTNLDTYKSSLKCSEKELDSWVKSLNRLKIDENEWKIIRDKCKSSIDLMNDQIKSLKNNMLLNKLDSKEKDVSSFVSKFHIQLCHMDIDSVIVSKKEKKHFAELLGFIFGQKSELLYRASRDGFTSNAFHTKCDGKAKTLTIVKSIQNDSVFGGYTTCAWDISEKFKSGYDDFLFSFKNTHNRPIRLDKKLNVCSSIYCSRSCGPIFGDAKGLDLKIGDSSNTSLTSFSNLGVSFPHPKFVRESDEAMSFLAGSAYFYVADMEVFQIH